MGCGCSKGYGLPPPDDDAQPPASFRPKRSSFGSRRLHYSDFLADGVGSLKEKVVRSSSAVPSHPPPQHHPPPPAPPPPNPRPPPRHLLDGEYVAAGWPTWLSAVAGEAIRGWIPRRADSFEKLDKIGQGTYSNVYKARDLETGRIVALKKVRFDNLEPESVRFMAREIQVLRRLEHPNIIKLEGLVTSRMSCSLYLVFEYMEHDLAGLAASPGTKFSEPQVKCYLQQLLRGLDHCHTRGVLHRDIKGSNLLLDNSGILKIADFGLATFFSYEQRQPLTSRVVTLWYRPPELLLGATEYGVGVDLWSTGCILAELLAGKPIMPGRTEVEQLHKIFKLCGSPSEEYWRKSKLPHATIFKPKQPYKRCIAETFRDFPPSAVASLETLLAIEPADRGTAAGALKSEFFSTKPFACDPSSLPKYPPSKELDAKLRDEEARRQRALGGRVPVGDSGRRVSKAVPAPDANAELPASIQKRKQRPLLQAVKSKSEKFNQKHEDTAVGFPIEPPCPPDGSAVFGPPGGFAPILEYSTADFTGLKKPDEAHTMDFSHPSRSRSSNKSSSMVSNPRTQTGDVLAYTKNIEESRQHEISRPKDVYCVTQNQSGERVGLSSKPAKNGVESGAQQNGTHRVQHERLGIGGGKRINYSGPLLRPSSNLDDILGQHEQQIQQAVRRSQQDKGKNRTTKASSRNAWPSASRQSNQGLPPNNSGRWKQNRTHSGGDPARLTETVRYDAQAPL